MNHALRAPERKRCPLRGRSLTACLLRSAGSIAPVRLLSRSFIPRSRCRPHAAVSKGQRSRGTPPGPPSTRRGQTSAGAGGRKKAGQAVGRARLSRGPLRVRHREWAQLHANLAILAQGACAVANAHATALADTAQRQREPAGRTGLLAARATAARACHRRHLRHDEPRPCQDRDLPPCWKVKDRPTYPRRPRGQQRSSCSGQAGSRKPPKAPPRTRPGRTADHDGSAIHPAGTYAC
jgi:hypothetical protein